MIRTACLLSLGALALAAAGPEPKLQTFHHENVLGTSAEIRVRATTPAAANRAESAALDEIDRLSRILSGYDPSSEFSRWERTRGEPVSVSPELAEVLRLWDHWATETHGTLNPAIETATRLWQAGRLPSDTERAAAVERMRGPHWRLDGATAVRLGTAPLRLNSFTKSWILARAISAALREPGVEGLTLNIGGDLVSAGAIAETADLRHPRTDAENAAPLASVRLSQEAMATSGDYRRGFTIDGRRYSHILDPRTAWPAERWASVTVISPDPVEAGALATAFSVTTLEETERIAARHPRAEYLLVAANGIRHASPRSRFVAAAATPPPSAAASDPAHVQIEFELARAGGGRYRRPFVAVWIEDSARNPVRTLALWFDRPRWLPDLSAWSRGERVRAAAEGNDLARTVGSATRPPGKYNLQWDGRDQSGKPVKPGKYTLLLEAAREHGGHDVLRQEIDLASPASFSVTGGSEISAATVEVKKVR